MEVEGLGSLLWSLSRERLVLARNSCASWTSLTGHELPFVTDGFVEPSASCLTGAGACSDRGHT
jgi:hypothetical protein